MTGPTEEPVVAVLAEEWSAICDLGAELDAEEWDLASECPGWTVRDLVSHMIGTERSLLGEPSPAPLAERPPHIRNDVGASNEAWVADRRTRSGKEVLDEFREVTDRRLVQLRSFAAERFERPGASPVGEVPYREFMQVRVMDCWTHEQDMRVATGRPGHRQNDAAEISIDRMASAMPFVVAKRAGAPDATAVRFEVTGVPARRVGVVVRDGRGRVEPVDVPTIELTMDSEVFWRLSCGRITGDAALDGAMVTVAGDAALGRRILDNMAFMI